MTPWLTVPGPVFILVQITGGACAGFWVGYAVKRLYRLARQELQQHRLRQAQRQGLDLFLQEAEE